MSARKFHDEDISVSRVIKGDDGHPVHIRQMIIGAYIYRIAESTEWHDCTVIWIQGEDENYPMTIYCPFDEFYPIWLESRRNSMLNGG